MQLRSWRSATVVSSTTMSTVTSPSVLLPATDHPTTPSGLSLQQAHQQAIEDIKNAKLRRSTGTKRTRREFDE